MAGQHSSRGLLVASIVAAVILFAVVVPFSLKGGRSAPAADPKLGVAERIQPVARFEAGQPEAGAAGKAATDGGAVFDKVCAACHNSGAAGAPKPGDKAAWAPRLARGKDALYNSAIKGKGSMPPKGGAANLSDDEVRAAVDYLAGKAK